MWTTTHSGPCWRERGKVKTAAGRRASAKRAASFSARTARPSWRPPLDFTYLRPGKVVWTELEVEERELVTPDDASLGRIKEFGYEASDGEGSGTLTMTLSLSGGSKETVTLQKAQE